MSFRTAREICSFQEEFRRLLNQLEVLKEKNILLGNQELVNKLAAMLEASNRAEAQVSTIQAISSSVVRSNDLGKSTEETNLGHTCQQQDRPGRKRTSLSTRLRGIARAVNFSRIGVTLSVSFSKLAACWLGKQYQNTELVCTNFRKKITGQKSHS